MLSGLRTNTVRFKIGAVELGRSFKRYDTNGNENAVTCLCRPFVSYHINLQLQHPPLLAPFPSTLTHCQSYLTFSCYGQVTRRGWPRFHVGATIHISTRFDNRLFLQSPEAFVAAVVVAVMAPVLRFWALQVSALLLALVSLALPPQNCRRSTCWLSAHRQNHRL
jgi:hypothetical protein